MTDPIRPNWDAGERAALDRFTVPAPRGSLAEDIVAAAMASGGIADAPASRAPRDRRGSWMRGSRIAAGVMAVGLMSATAAASGWLGEAGSKLPVIATIATVIPDQIKAKPAAKPAPVVVARAAPPVEAMVPTPEVAALDPAAEQRAQAIIAHADRIEAMLDRKDARRKAAGLPSATVEERNLLSALRMAKTEEERASVMAELGKLKQARKAAFAGRAGGEGPRLAFRGRQEGREMRAQLPACTPEQAAQPWANRCRPSPEQRAATFQAFAERCRTVAADDPIAARCARAAERFGKRRRALGGEAADAAPAASAPSVSEQPAEAIPQ